MIFSTHWRGARFLASHSSGLCRLRLYSSRSRGCCGRCRVALGWRVWFGLHWRCLNWEARRRRAATLLFVLRTVAYLWRQEAQSRNAKDIANRGSQLYDKLVGFLMDLESVGARLDAAALSYRDAHRNLSSGQGI